MSFTGLLLLVYVIMGTGTFLAFRRKQKEIGMALLFAMLLSIMILGYMWIHSPM